jgi:hypothetical protein
LFFFHSGHEKMLRGKTESSISRVPRALRRASLAQDQLLSPSVFAGFRCSFFFGLFALSFVPRGYAISFPSSGPTVPGNVAYLRRGVAYAPASAPVAVKRAIWAANQLRAKPYRWGGGHATFFDAGYDCSGTISYALGAAGLIRIPMNSSELTHFGDHGRGKWITIYARNGHAFAVIAGLRLDTTAWSNRSDREAPRWQLTDRPPRGFESRHPIGL